MAARGAGQVSAAGLIGAIDIGGSKIEVGIADRKGNLLAQERFKTQSERGPEAVVSQAVAALKVLVGERNEKLVGIGVGCVGPLDLVAGVIKSPPNFPGWQHVPLKSMLEKGLDAPVLIENDANAAALAEFHFGAGQGASILVYVTVSTGVGGGIIVNGRLLHGVGGGAGEFGHQTIHPGGLPCGCGNCGCLEVYASGTAIVGLAKAAIANGSGRAIEKLCVAQGVPLHAGHVALAASAGDAAALTIWSGAIEALALGLGNVISTVAPDRLVIGGGVSLAGDLLLQPLREGLARHVRMVPIEQVAISITGFEGNAGLFGAVAVGLSVWGETAAAT
jgi:glucokinase